MTSLRAAGDPAALHVRLESLVWAYRILLFAGPVAAGLIAARIGREMRARIAESEVYPSDATTLVRNAEGGFDEEEPQPA